METILKEFGLSEKQKLQFLKYSEFLVLENAKYNLTSITDYKEIYIKHFYDSLKLSNVLDFKNVRTFCDIGSGAGFPAIPLKILFPHLLITIIEPTKKRCEFLRKLNEILELDNIIIVNDRSENIKDELRDSFEIVSARAVASLPVLLELTIPYLKVNGYFLALKGISYKEELDSATGAIKELDLRVVNIYDYNLPLGLGKRVIINFQKLSKTKRIYPRKYAVIKKKHL